MNKVLNFKGFVNEMVDERTTRIYTKRGLEKMYNRYAKLWGAAATFTLFYSYLQFMAMVNKNSPPRENVLAINILYWLIVISVSSLKSNFIKKIYLKNNTENFIEIFEELSDTNTEFNLIEKELIQQKNEYIKKIDLFYDNHHKLFEDEGVDIGKFIKIFSTTSIFKKVGSPYNYIKGNNLLKEHSYLRKDIEDIQRLSTKIQYNINLHMNMASKYLSKKIR